MRVVHRLLLSGLLLLAGMAGAVAQMPPTLLLDTEPSVPSSTWVLYEASLLPVMLCEAPISISKDELDQLATKTRDNGITIVPPRTFQVFGFDVQNILFSRTTSGQYSYQSSSIVATPPLWATAAGSRGDAFITRPGTTASLLTISCKERA